MRTQAASLLVTTLLLIAPAVAHAQAPSGSLPSMPLPHPVARDGVIAYSVAQQAGNRSSDIVHVVGPDGSYDRAIGDGRCPTFSADGTVLARWTGRRPRPSNWAQTLTVSAPDGGDPRNVLGIDENPFLSTTPIALSPDGSRVAWVHPTDRDGSRELWVGPIPGGPGTLLVPATFAPASLRLPVWSPDGRSIAFEADDGSTLGRSIYVVDAQGGSPRLLSARLGGQDAVAWSPDGREIAYSGVPDAVASPTSTAAVPGAPGSPRPGTDVTMDLFVIGADGAGERDITGGPEDDSVPRWSPDGTQIAFVRDYAMIEIVDARPGEAPSIAHVAGGDGVDGFSWSPDGSRLLAVARTTIDGTQAGGSALDTTTVRTIPLGEGTPWSTSFQALVLCPPSWQALLPDGQP